MEIQNRQGGESMIKEIRVENWKSFSRATFYIDPLTVVIGANASGKSNLLDVFPFLMRIAKNIPIAEAINGNATLRPIRGGAEWICRKPSDEFTISVGVEKAENQTYWYTISCKVGSRSAEVIDEKLELVTVSGKKGKPKPKNLFYTRNETDTPSLPTYFITGSRGAPNRIALNRFSSLLAQAENLILHKSIADGVKMVLEKLKNIFVLDPIPDHMREYTSLTDTLQADGSNVAGVIAGLEDREKRRMEEELTACLKDLPEREVSSIWAETVGKYKSDAMLYCREGWNHKESEFDSRGMSDGTLRCIAIVTALLTRRKNSLLIVEEIDNGLHPSRAEMLIEALQRIGRERNIDIVATTHNPAMLDALGNSMIPFITVAWRDDETGSSRLKPLDEIGQLPKLMATGSVGRLSTERKIERAVKMEKQDE